MKNHNIIQNKYSALQLFALTILRISIGWHFLYEGLVKLYNPTWSSSYYLESSAGPFMKILNFFTSDQLILTIIDFTTIWGLILIGISLFLGLFTKPFKIFAIVLLILYYFTYPPFAGLEIPLVTEGSYWIVNKNLIEAFALLVLYVFPSSHITGLDKFLFKNKGTGNE